MAALVVEFHNNKFQKKGERHYWKLRVPDLHRKYYLEPMACQLQAKQRKPPSWDYLRVRGLCKTHPYRDGKPPLDAVEEVAGTEAVV